MIKLKIVGKGEVEKACSVAGDNETYLVYHNEFEDGDRIAVNTDGNGRFIVAKFEDSMTEAFIYVPGMSMGFFIPPKNNRPNYSPKSFIGDCHFISVRYASDEEISKRKNLALNVYDQHENANSFPHASANIETRGEAVFAARNAIDGIYANDSHGRYPYESWGINRDPKAALTIDFGREVRIDEIRITERADFPHDNYWVEARLSFDDGSFEIIKLKKSDKPQCFKIKERVVKSFTLDHLIQAKGPSPFPALTQIEAWGYEN